MGTAEVQSRVQLVPSQSHVSLIGPSANGSMWSPPYMTVRPSCASYAIECQKRGYGSVPGLRWVQFAPSHSHVSFMRCPATRPPKSTRTPRAESKANAIPNLGEGEDAGAIFVQ